MQHLCRIASNEKAEIPLGSTDEIGSPVKVDSEEINDNWSEVSPSKIGRSPLTSPVRKHLEEPIISASKFSVLSMEEEEEDGDIKEASSEKDIERDTIG